jgi:ketosteroid isomerase-like protein
MTGTRSTAMSNVEKLRKAYQAWNDTRGASVSEWMELLADDVVVKSLAGGAPEMEFTTTCQCRADVGEYFAGLARDWEMLHYTVEEFIAEGARVVAIGRCGWRSRHTGKAVESPTVSVWRFRDGKVTEFFEFYDTAKAFAAARPD